MPQGSLSKAKGPATRSHVSSTSRKGRRQIAPKRAGLVQQNKITKKYSAGLIARTEKVLAEKAGHLEMLAGGKRKATADQSAGHGHGSAKTAKRSSSSLKKTGK